MALTILLYIHLLILPSQTAAFPVCRKRKRKNYCINWLIIVKRADINVIPYGPFKK